jgi:S-adenosylmethionine:tRNA ribosyltransferase-isomerase
MKKSNFYYDLPQELIAQHPLPVRDDSRLLVLGKQTGEIQHKKFRDMLGFLRAGDCLIMNNTRVLPARLYGTREDTGARVEFLLLNRKTADLWEVLTGPGKKAKIGTRFVFADGLLKAEIMDVFEDGNRIARFEYQGDFYTILEAIGEMPLPHYITEALEDKDRYQTVYAKEPGSAAAPTAGLHFTPELLDELRAAGVQIGYVTLHVGLGTFRPVKTQNIEDHHMHAEHFVLPEETARLIRQTKANNGRVFAVGTTCCRTLESVMLQKGEMVAHEAWTDIFIYPGLHLPV